jgi:hypothetical protein
VLTCDENHQQGLLVPLVWLASDNVPNTGAQPRARVRANQFDASENTAAKRIANYSLAVARRKLNELQAQVTSSVGSFAERVCRTTFGGACNAAATRSHYQEGAALDVSGVGVVQLIQNKHRGTGRLFGYGVASHVAASQSALLRWFAEKPNQYGFTTVVFDDTNCWVCMPKDRIPLN